MPPGGARKGEAKESYPDSKLTIKLQPRSYRIRTIKVKRSNAIDQIRIEYDDDTVWSVGHAGGKSDRRTVIMTQGEYLVKVSHERFVNHSCAAAAVSFTTNKGRVFAFKPRRLTTSWASETVEVKAEAGYEIIALRIKQGVLLGSVQQRTPEEEAGVAHPSTWLCVASCDGEVGKGEVRYSHFHKSGAAKQAFSQAKAEGHVALLLDCMKLQCVRSCGSAAASKSLKGLAEGKGYSAPRADDDVRLLDTLRMLFRLLAQRDDLINFAQIVVLLVISFYASLEATMLTGQVVAAVTSNEAVGSTLASRAVCYVAGCSPDPALEGSSFAPSPAVVAIAAFLLAKFADSLADVANVWIHHNACDVKGNHLKSMALQKVLSLSQAYFDTHATSEIRSSTNVENLSDMITWNVPYLLTYSIKLVMVAYFLLSIHVVMGGMALAALVTVKFCFLDPMEKRERSLNKYERKLQVLGEQIMDESFDNLPVLKTFSKERYHIAEHKSALQRATDNLGSIVAFRCVREFTFNFLCSTIFGGVLYYAYRSYGGVEGGASMLTAASMTSFFLLLTQAMELFGHIKWHFDFLLRQYPDIERFLDLMKQEPAVVSGSELVEELHGSIEFQGVTFQYPSRPGERVLDELDLSIEAGKMTAIVGDSGAGKSTLTKLIMRQYDPESGRILVDGRPLTSLELESYHKHIAIVAQNPTLFNMSLADNIAYGSPSEDVSEEEILEAARVANCYDFITAFRAGFDTFAGSGGAQLSGGQRQRIAIARAAIRKPELLILDEATSALDAESEMLVQSALEKLMKGITTVVIAHRLSTVKNADVIICMKAGKVVERGSHEELMSAGGVYSELVRHQLCDDVEDQDSDGGCASNLVLGCGSASSVECSAAPSASPVISSAA